MIQIEAPSSQRNTEKRAVSVFLRVLCGSLRLEDQAFEESEAEE
jgi:hypothetical protein